MNKKIMNLYVVSCVSSVRRQSSVNSLYHGCDDTGRWSSVQTTVVTAVMIGGEPWLAPYRNS